MTIVNKDFAKALIKWHIHSGRKHLPWQKNINPYRVWVSEIMLQQTQVSTVIDYYHKFMETFPCVSQLALADEQTVFAHWAGLGYYQRARNLHKASRIIHHDYQAIFPTTPAELISLPGIGKSTAHAILSICKNLPYPILDGNVKRVLSRHFAITKPIDQTTTIKQLWHLASQVMPQEDCGIYSQAIMDLGAMVCKKKPLCQLCPVQKSCVAKAKNIHTLLPHKTPRRKPKCQNVYCLCFFHNNLLFLKRRGETGIWPQLWSPLIEETPPEESADQKSFHLPPFKHTLTHIEMTIFPIIIFASSPPGSGRGQWLCESKALSAGIPAAIKKLIMTHRLFHFAKTQAPKSCFMSSE